MSDKENPLTFISHDFFDNDEKKEKPLSPGQITRNHISIPFDALKINNYEHLFAKCTKTECPRCYRKKMYFCYDCMLPLDPEKTPHMFFPVHIDIIHHPTELLSKSTAVHAKLLAAESVSFYEFPSLPKIKEYKTDEIALLYPSNDAKLLEEFDQDSFSKIKRIIVIDSQWTQAKRIFNTISFIPIKIKINNYKTFFWRWQHKGDDHLATIEAIYYCLVEYHKKMRGVYDDTKKRFGRISNYIKNE